MNKHCIGNVTQSCLPSGSFGFASQSRLWLLLATITELSPVLWLCLVWLSWECLHYTIPSVSVLLLFHLWSTSLSFVFFSQNGVMNPDVLNCCWYAGDSQIYSSNPKFPQSLDLYFYYLLTISMDMSIWTQPMSPTKCVPPEFLTWWPSQSTQAHQLETFTGLNSFLNLTSQHITSFPLQQSFLNLTLSLPFASNLPEPGIWSHIVLSLNSSSISSWLRDRRVI